MNVDKFGRHNSSGRGEKGPKGDGFHFTEDGNYDLQNKRMCNIGNAESKGDAVNLGIISNLIKSCVKENGDGVIDISEKIITALHDPKTESDAVNLRTLKRSTIMLTNNGFNARNHKITAVKPPTNPPDVVNLKYFNDNTMVLDTKSNTFDAAKKKLTNLLDPVNSQDAVTYSIMMKIFGKMGYAMYNQLHKDKKVKLTAEEWYNMVKVNPLAHLTWENAFNFTKKDNKIN